MTIIQRLQEQMSGGVDPTGKEPDPARGEATTPPKK
jgi:hypothetical protein